MGYWEFLLQKKGERSWLPLKKQQLEVEAGYYRMVAHTSRAKTDVEVRLSYLDSREFPAKRRSQKRLRSTNSEGLMVIMPFTLLKPGLWEVRCCGDILSDFIGESWQEMVQLQVLPGSAATEQKATSDAKLIPTRQQNHPRKQKQLNNSNAIAAQLRQKKRLARKKRLSQFILGSDSATEISSVFLEETRQEDLILGADSPGELVTKAIETEVEEDFATAESPDVISDAETTTESISSEENEVNPVVEIVDQSPDVIADAETTTENISSEENLVNPVVEIIEQSPDVIADADASTENISSEENEVNPVVEIIEQSPDVIADADTSTENISSDEDVIDPVVEIIEQSPDVILDADASTENISSEEYVIDPVVEIIEQSPDVIADSDASTENISSEENEVNPVVEIIEQSPDVIADADASTETQEVEQLIIGCDAIAEPPDSIPTPKPNELILGADSPGELVSQTVETEIEVDETEATAESPEVISDADTSEELVTPTTSITENVGFTLEKETFVWNLGQPIVISGCITSNDSDESVGNIGFNGQIRYQLRHPQTSDIVVEKKQSVAASNLPVNFSHNLEIPTTCSATLILGEAILETEDSSITFATIAFSITAEVSQLLATVDLDSYETIIPEIVSPKPSVPLNLDLLDLANQPKTSHQSEPTSSVVLPPVIKRSPLPSKPTFTKPPELPHFTDNTPPEPEVVTEAEVSEENNFDLDLEDDFLEIEAEIIETPETEYVVEDETEATPTSTLEATTQETIEPWQGQTSDTEGEKVTDEIDVAFQSLNLESYFWSRLVSLAHNRELSQSLLEDRNSEQTVIQEPNTQIQEPIAEDSEPLPDLATLKSTPDWSNQEIVIEDEEIPLLESQIPHLDTSGLPYPPGVEPLDSSNLSQEELQREVPTPILKVTEGELTAGKPVVVRVKLPPCPNSVYVKIWVQDRQTRYLLDGPRALVEFTMNREGELETLTQVTVPLGSLEIRFEAIAIDIQTQRESRKASVDRKVVPADLPEFSLDEFDSNF